MKYIVFLIARRSGFMKAMCLPDRRFGHASLVTADGKLWVFGGNIAMVCNEDIPEERYEVYNPSDSVLYFDRTLGDSGEWHHLCAAMGATRIWLSVFDVDGYLYAVGGDADCVLEKYSCPLLRDTIDSKIYGKPSLSFQRCERSTRALSTTARS